MNMYKSLFIKILFIIFTILVMVNISEVQAQCPMCKASVESNLAKGETKGAGLNKGILFLLAAPYAAAGVIGYIFYKNHKQRKRYLQSQKLS